MIITIDGPAGSGKSTVAKLVSNKLNYNHINAGAIFRGITAYLIDIGFNIDSISADSQIPDMYVDLDFSSSTPTVVVCGNDYSHRLRDLDVTKFVPIVSQNKYVHVITDAAQRNYAVGKNVVAEGRDVGTNVFPNADYKFYLDCSIEERAKRRQLEYLDNNKSVKYEDILLEIQNRDDLDKTREIAPLVMPKNAIVIDTSSLSIGEVVEAMISHINSLSL